MRNFDFYEFAGVLTPGIILLVGLVHFFPSLINGRSIVEVSLGASGIVGVMGYAAGHLLQTIGNLVEWIYWATWGGRPTEWIYFKPHSLMPAAQIATLTDTIRRNFPPTDRSHDKRQRHLASLVITRRVYACVKANARSDRIDVFNANYGLCRGLVAAFLVLAVVCLVTKPHFAWRQALALVLLLIFSLQRMHRFATHYARELYVQYEQLVPAQKSPHIATAGGPHV